jgi:hypothetical protein
MQGDTKFDSVAVKRGEGLGEWLATGHERRRRYLRNRILDSRKGSVSPQMFSFSRPNLSSHAASASVGDDFGGAERALPGELLLVGPIVHRQHRSSSGELIHVAPAGVKRP